MMRSITMLFLLLCITACLIKCSWGAECTIAWDANPADQQVSEYRVYVGLNLLAITPNNMARVILPNAPCEVSVVAVNAVGPSAPARMKVSYITDSESVDMQAWAPMHSYHREFLPGRRFYRTKIETPP